MGDMADLIIYGEGGFRMCECCGEIGDWEGLRCPSCEDLDPKEAEAGNE
jgi:hypothetical protein